MFNSPLCARPFPKKPFFIEELIFGWLNKPLLVIIVILAFLGLGWVVQQKRWRRWLTSKRTIFLLFGFTGILPLMFVVAAQALVVFLPTDSGTATDAIVILGRGALFDEQRVNVAAELWQARRAPMIFASGRGDAQRMIEQLEAKGIPKQVLDGENCSVNTLENAVFAAAILHKQGIRRILLITDRPHMWRSLLVFRANGFTVIPHTTPIPPYLGRNLDGRKAKVSLTLREYAGLVSYGLRGLYLSQRSPQLNSPESVNIIQKAEQYGQQRRADRSV